jgi:hypothetical protein
MVKSDPTKININKHLKNVQLMEAECEQLSIQKIIDLDLGIKCSTIHSKSKFLFIILYCFKRN